MVRSMFRSALTATAVLLVLLGPVGAADNKDDDQKWTYLADVEGLRPIARSIGIIEERPQDIVEEIEYRGSLRRYAQLRYGSENSRRVVIVVDELGQGRYDFYVDLDRDRHITAEELIPGEGRSRTFELATEIIREGPIDRRRIARCLGEAL